MLLPAVYNQLRLYHASLICQDSFSQLNLLRLQSDITTLLNDQPVHGITKYGYTSYIWNLTAAFHVCFSSVHRTLETILPPL